MSTLKQISNRIITKPGYKVIAVALVLYGMVNLLNSTDPYYKLQHDENRSLECYMTDGIRIIDKEKVTGFDDITNTWFFINGYSSNCRVLGNTSNF